MTLIKRLPLNERGRDLLVGDIHGEFSRLEELLAAANFNPDIDRLISVGDLVDRGPDSDQVLDWLSRPWVHAVLGNHELMAMAHACNGEGSAADHVQNGGAWMAAMELEVRMEYAEAFARLPLAIEIQTARGPIGVVHADTPPGLSWQALCAELDADNRDSANWLLWSRQRLESAAQGEATPDVVGIRRVYVGHTTVKKPVAVGNVCYIDTGAHFGGVMMLIDANTGALVAQQGP
jgi:serine/threonine protein phosphatase 1